MTRAAPANSESSQMKVRVSLETPSAASIDLALAGSKVYCPVWAKPASVLGTTPSADETTPFMRLLMSESWSTA
jgi:hypothetical protein